jgi:glycosyltransferase involved in cell wall biosynthesis
VRVLIDTTYARRAPYSGTGIYTRMLCAELAALEGIELVQVANERRRQPAGGGLGSLQNLAADSWWTSLALPRLARRSSAEVIHHPLPSHCPITSIPQVVTVHDLSFERLPDCFDRRFRTYAHLTHRAAARAAGAVISVSETTARDVQEVWGVQRDRIVVAREGPGQQLAIPSRKPPAPPTHFLYVGDEEPRKDLGTLLNAYRKYHSRSASPLELVLAGSASAGLTGVRVEARPDAERLSQLYSRAAALVHPSRYEGFGLTVLEAMTLGVPVLAARSPGVLEVGGDAVSYAEPGNAEAFAQEMDKLAQDAQLRADLAERGWRRGRDFSWARCARDHLAAYSLARQR